VPQLADLFSVLPHDDMVEMMSLLPTAMAERIRSVISDRESTAGALMSTDCVVAAKEVKAGDMLREIRTSNREHEAISYVYVVGLERTLLGVVDLRDLVLAADDMPLGELMTSPVVAAEEDDIREDIVDLFAKYHYRMLPVVDPHDRLLGVIHYKDIMKGLITRAQP